MSKKIKFELNENNISLFIELKQETKRNENQIIESYIDYLNDNIKQIKDTYTKQEDNNETKEKNLIKFINKFKIDSIKYFKYDLDRCVGELQKNNILITKKQIIKIFNFIDNI